MKKTSIFFKFKYRAKSFTNIYAVIRTKKYFNLNT
jgi:hypothetical protein